VDLSSFLTPDLVLSLAALLFPFAWHGAQLLLVQALQKLPANARSLAQDIVTSAVHAVEQSYPELKGADKHDQAMSIIQKQLAQKKLSVSPDEISVLLEEAVFLMNGSKAPAVNASTPVGFHG
jgi:hypothetical protein